GGPGAWRAAHGGLWSGHSAQSAGDIRLGPAFPPLRPGKGRAGTRRRRDRSDRGGRPRKSDATGGRIRRRIVVPADSGNPRDPARRHLKWLRPARNAAFTVVSLLPPAHATAL